MLIIISTLDQFFISNGKIKNELNARIVAARKLFRAITQNLIEKKKEDEVLKRIKIIIFKNMYDPILIYASKSLPLKSKE